MKSPLWILNITLVFLLVVSAVLMYLLIPAEPVRVSLVSGLVQAPKEDIFPVNESRIYENDPFNTTKKVEPLKPEEKKGEEEIVIPPPPTRQPPAPVYDVEPEFLQLLPFKLRGVVFNSSPLYSRAILADVRTKVEKLYKIGDQVEDAVLTYIGKNKIILTRSNGQQEALFLNETAAQDDPIYKGNRDWSAIIKQVNERVFRVDGRLFKRRIQSVAQIIDILDITTAFDAGKSIGCRIGPAAPGSFAAALGLKTNDIIISVNGIFAKSTSERVKIYKSIAEGGWDQKIEVICKRHGAERKLTYLVFRSEEDGIDGGNKISPDLVAQLGTLPAGTPIPPTDTGYPDVPADRTSETKKLIQDSLATASGQDEIAEEYKRQDKKMMLDFGGRDAVLQR